MIIYSEDRYVPTDVNMLVIGDGTGYYYVHRMLYDQAVILYDIFGSDMDILLEDLTGSKEHRPDVEFFWENTPAPLKIFAPFLMFVDDMIEQYDDMVGAIHVMSGPCNLRKLVGMPKEVRNTPTFSLSIKEEYQLAWDRFFKNTLPYSEDMFFNTGAPMNGVMTSTVEEPQKPGLSTVGADGVDYGDPLAALLFAPDDDLFAMPPSDGEETVAEPEPVSAPAPEPEPVSAPVPEPEPVPEKPKSGLDALLGGL